MYLPKNTFPFTYLAITVKKQNIDVNIHPTKREVLILYQDEIIEELVDAIVTTLQNANTSRTFMTQSLLPGANTGVNAIQREENKENQQRLNTPVPVNRLVRTDSKAMTLDAFITPIKTFSSPIKSSQGQASHAREYVDVRLDSIRGLRSSLISNTDKYLLQLLQNHTYVGYVDSARALIQHDTKLYMVNYQDIAYEMFYALGLKAFNNFGVIRFTPISVRDAIAVSLKDEDFSGYTQGTDDGEAKKRDIASVLYWFHLITDDC
jgi:DNA mismatch repair protein MLH1